MLLFVLQKELALISTASMRRRRVTEKRSAELTDASTAAPLPNDSRDATSTRRSSAKSGGGGGGGVGGKRGGGCGGGDGEGRTDAAGGKSVSDCACALRAAASARRATFQEAISWSNGSGRRRGRCSTRRGRPLPTHHREGPACGRLGWG